ncbi:MAG: hypothetical protein QXK37_06530 [Candidatus Woesearchaeota archaeon]
MRILLSGLIILGMLIYGCCEDDSKKDPCEDPGSEECCKLIPTNPVCNERSEEVGKKGTCGNKKCEPGEEDPYGSTYCKQDCSSEPSSGSGDTSVVQP